LAVDTDDEKDKVCDNAVRVNQLRQACAERQLSIKMTRHRTTHVDGVSNHAFILTDDVHKASHCVIRKLRSHRLTLQFTTFLITSFNFS